MVYFGVTPPSLRACWTTLIPKSPDHLEDVSNWRPISVGPLLVRILHRILARRLPRLPFHNAQRGFVSLDGTFANVLLLQTAIKNSRQKLQPHQITSLDLKRAFDTVPHASIRRACRRFQHHPKLTEYIMSSLSGAHTTISCGKTRTPSINILRGVKQGDPLSPLIFNMVLDELLVRIDILGVGITVGDQRISVLAYADDLVLLSGAPGDQQRLLNLTHTFFEE